jgi:hypothetical protein
MDAVSKRLHGNVRTSRGGGELRAARFRRLFANVGEVLIYHCNRSLRQTAGRTAQEDIMAKGQMRSNKEKKKPKVETEKVKQVSAYKASQSQGGKK